MSARPRETRIPIGPLVAAIGAVLLIVSLGLDWYGQYSGFNSFEFLDLLLVGLALVTLTELAAALGLLRTPLRRGTALVVGAIALVVVLSQLVNHPPLGIDKDVETGLWLGLAGAALMLAGAILATARIALAVEPRTRAAAAPPPPASSAPPADSPPAPARPADSPPASSRPSASPPADSPARPADQAPTIADEPRP
jgi:hypothetical protein